METLETTLQVNKFARRSRHSRIFSRTSLWKSGLLLTLKALATAPGLKRSLGFLSSIKHSSLEFLPVTPSRRLLFQAGVLALGWTLITSFSSTATFTAASMDYSNDYIAAYSLPGDILVTDEVGYLVKINPQTNASNRIGLTDYAVHTVENGETLSQIAEAYGVKVETVMWQNNIGNANSLRIGQTLLVPPVDGVSYKVKGADSLSKIADKYDISVESIIAQNGLADEVIQKGQSLFLPGAKPLYDPVTIARNTSVSRDTRALSNAKASNALPAGGKMFIYPTMGKVTQGFHGGHYALDIADTSRPAVWAAGGGTVEKVSTGTWGGGYGNHIIVNHGNGVKTLYAHLGSANVYAGQYVNQGDVIGIMGNTGRVYGVTGIHLHYEVRVNGVKKNPWSYM